MPHMSGETHAGHIGENFMKRILRNKLYSFVSAAFWSVSVIVRTSTSLRIESSTVSPAL